MEEVRTEQQEQDFRFFRLMELVNAVAGSKKPLKAGTLFPSLKKLEDTAATGDGVQTMQALKAMFESAARRR